MNFFNDILAAVKRKSAELKDRREFLNMVEAKAKPIRRAAYMQQMLKEVVNEGIEKAKQDAATKVKKPRSEESFGLGGGLQDPYKFLKPKVEK